MIPPAFVHLGIGTLIALLAVPLWLRKVPMNRLYGVRIPEAFASDEDWYAINAHGGKLLFWYGLALASFGALSGPFAPDPRSLWSLPFVVVPLLMVFPVLARIVIRARRR